MAAQNAIGVALIGYGLAGEVFHAPLVDATDGLELAVVSSSRRDKVQAHFPSARVVAQPEYAIDDADIRLVVIASPNTSHVPLATAALHAGKHVVVDKPFTITTAEARALVQLAEEKELLLSVFHNRRWDGDFLTIRSLMVENKLGPINYFESHFDRYRPEVRDRWRERSGAGSGLWYDLGPHLVDQALVLFGMPSTVQATIVEQRPRAVTDDYAHVVLGYGSTNDETAGRASCLQVVLHGTMLASGGWPRFLVHGSEASWLKHGLDSQEAQLASGMRPGNAGWGVDTNSGTLFKGDTAATIPNCNGSYQDYYAGIRDAIQGVAPNPVPGEQAVRVMQVIEAAIESAHSGRRIAIEPASGGTDLL